MRYKSFSFIILTGLLAAISGCGSDDKKSNSSQVCCVETDDAGAGSMCTCGPQGTTSAAGITMTITVNGSSCTVSDSSGSYTGKVVPESDPACS